ncbi:MAG: aldehyde dehydrogenase family protein [Deltaproteobacteria bacterium]|nr:aldehyde dehydrogenase family protein [Deltaproteobacteria bacterium]
MSQTEGDIRHGVEAAVARARGAQPAWARLSFRARGRALRSLAARARRDVELASIISQETGKPAFEAIGFEIAYLCEVTRFLSGRNGRRALCEDRRSSLIFPHKRARVAWRPRGVVAVIGPANFPLLNNFGDAVAPLLAGNSVVLKPSPRAPGAARQMQLLWKQAGLPESVFQVIEGDVETSRALVDTCDMVFFTGGVAAGREIAARAGQRLIPCVAELGGKSAMIVLGDADLRAAARAAVWGAFAGAGQVCIRVERVLVEAAVADAFARLVADESQRLRLGTKDADVGPLLLPSQRQHCRALVADAVARGARVLVGGGEAADDAFPPTVLDRVPPDAAVAVEETFGPVLPIVRVADAEEAVRLANDSRLGLSGSVWSRDQARALGIARRLQSGSLCLNDVLVNYFFVSAPLGGTKASGLGFRHGPEALRQFCWAQTIVEDRPLSRPLANWVRRQLGFPYRKRVLDVVRWLLGVLYR